MSYGVSYILHLQVVLFRQKLTVCVALGQVSAFVEINELIID